MTVLEQISNPYLASLVLGLLYGLTFCASACLPYIVSYIAGIGAGFKKGVMVTTIYNAGRIVAYAIIGTIVGLVSATISEDFFSAYQQYTAVVFSAIIIFIGATILMKKQTSSCDCKEQNPDRFGIANLTNRFDLKAFFMGFTRGFILCPPLVALLVYSATFGQVNSAVMAVLFGLGTAISPLLILGGATGWLLNKAPMFTKWLSKIGGIALIVMGLSVLISALIELM
ncbi:MAG: sulfite exporter TauE/SafE family protein [Candidatus Bathyarchaeota archaeon]|nr:sulfite exporter TauE/SafE family protein [Candidatus Bathyarchaeum tardum]WNZ29705.1 MAG: sulfite exporter TauE/SafE family protein [Candidatus Bathyarchaeota archaeon]